MISTNQTHVDVVELALEKQRWKNVENILRSFCAQNKITFTHRRCENISEYTRDKILVTWLFDLIDYDYFNNAADQCEKLGKKLYVVTDSWLDPEKFQHPAAKFFSLPKLFGLTALTGLVPELKQQSKLYNAFNHRVDATRQSWFYFLYLRNLLERGYVSYRLFQINTKVTGRELFDQIHNDHLSAVDHFNQAYHALKTQIPYSNFEDRSDLSDIILETKYSLVSDTFAVQDNTGAYYISEKVTRALQYPNVNLLFLQKDTLHKLHQDDLYIHPDLLEIDSCNWIERQQKILQILEHDTISSTPQELYDQAAHNRTVLNSWLSQCLESSFYEEVFETILSD